MSKKKYYDKNPEEQAAQEELEDQEMAGSGSKVKPEVVLLAVIAIALVVQTFIMISGNDSPQQAAYVPAGNNSAAMNQQQAQRPQQQQPQQQPQMQTQDAAQQFNVEQQPQAQPPAADPNATVANYSESTHDFGVVGADAGLQSHTFTVTNDGSQPLAYTNVRGDAGLTVTAYPTSPIPPGGSGEIKVQFDPSQSKGLGNQAYNIHLDGNTNPGHQHLVIQATVN